MSTQQTTMTFEEVVIQPAFTYDGKTYLVSGEYNEVGDYHEVDDTVFVRKAKDGKIEVRNNPDPDAECEVAERDDVVSGKLTLNQWRNFITEVESALDELVIAGRTESDRLELRLPAEI